MKIKRFLSRRFFLSLLILCFLVNCSMTAQEDSTKVVHFERGCKEYHFGIPFLYLEGTDYEVGYQYGYLLKNELTSFYGVYEKFKNDFFDKEIGYLPWYQRIFANVFGSMVFNRKINSYADKLETDILEQIDGASKGSGLPVSFFKELLVFYDMYSKRCEAVVIKKGNHTYHGHNLDQPGQLNLLSKYPVVVNYDIKGKQKYTDFGFSGLLMPTTAFNESGISLSENGNNNPFGFDQDNCTLYSEKGKLITQTRNLKEVDSIAGTLKFPIGIIFTIASSKEGQGVVYDFIGSIKAVTPVNSYQFVANRTVSNRLGKKYETINSGKFHEEARVVKFAELVDTSKQNMIDELIGILSNTSFYHYADSIHVWIEALHNYETDQSVIFDLADSSVYFTYYAHYAAWNRWLKYNYATRTVSVYKEADSRLSDPFLSRLIDLYKTYEACDWRDSANIKSLVNSVLESGINNYFTLTFLSTTYLNYYHIPAQAKIYAEKLIEKYPDIITGYFNRGRSFEEENKPEEAVNEYMRALASKIQCEYYLAATYERLAHSLYSLGKKDQAAEYTVKSLDIYKQYWVPEYLKERIRELEKMKIKSD
jgi:tetratricopeptide (TPR) repeat protein